MGRLFEAQLKSHRLDRQAREQLLLRGSNPPFIEPVLWRTPQCAMKIAFQLPDGMATEPGEFLGVITRRQAV
jgi:hypothetical protein